MIQINVKIDNNSRSKRSRPNVGDMVQVSLMKGLKPTVGLVYNVICFEKLNEIEDNYVTEYVLQTSFYDLGFEQRKEFSYKVSSKKPIRKIYSLSNDKFVSKLESRAKKLFKKTLRKDITSAYWAGNHYLLNDFIRIVKESGSDNIDPRCMPYPISVKSRSIVTTYNRKGALLENYTNMGEKWRKEQYSEIELAKIQSPNYEIEDSGEGLFKIRSPGTGVYVVGDGLWEDYSNRNLSAVKVDKSVICSKIEHILGVNYPENFENVKPKSKKWDITNKMIPAYFAREIPEYALDWVKPVRLNLE